MPQQNKPYCPYWGSLFPQLFPKCTAADFEANKPAPEPPKRPEPPRPPRPQYNWPNFNFGFGNGFGPSRPSGNRPGATQNPPKSEEKPAEKPENKPGKPKNGN